VNTQLPATSVPTLSETQRRLFQEILYHAIGYDRACRAADRAWRQFTGVPPMEEEILALEKAVSDLHARLAPVVIEWIVGLPDAAADGILDLDRSVSIGQQSLPRLFALAGISERFRSAAELEEAFE
jgi:hypothetical protein